MSANDILRIIKKAAEDTIENSKPFELQAGTVIQVSPLHIQTDANITHREEAGDLILTHLVRDYEVDITVNHSTDKIENIKDEKYIVPGQATNPIPGMVALTEHTHKYSGRKKIIMHLGLKVGEKVHLLQEQGGQRYVVLDRVDDPPVSGEWL